MYCSTSRVESEEDEQKENLEESLSDENWRMTYMPHSNRVKERPGSGLERLSKGLRPHSTPMDPKNVSQSEHRNLSREGLGP